MHMAAIAMVAAGLGGRAEFEGEVMPGPDAMARAGVRPSVLEPKDGLAMISANGVSVGGAALAAVRAAEVADVADLVLAVSLEAIGGNLSIVDPAVARAKPVAGQAESADLIRALLAGSDRCVPDAARSVQDALSFRVGPQTHGAYRDSIRVLTSAVETELSSSDDNPLVVTDEGRIVSNGNFHPMAMALAVDALRPALAHVGQLSSRRMSHLWATIFANPHIADAMLAVSEEGGLMTYAGAARYAELRALAGPVTLDVPPLDLGVEDHATNAPGAVFATDAALDALEDVLAIELLMARATLRFDPDVGRLGAGVAAALDEVDAIVSDEGPQAASEVLHAAVRDALRKRIAGAAAEAAHSLNAASAD
jgi:histidine ammonia-lyase